MSENKLPGTDEKQLKVPQFVAISNEPKANDDMAIHRLCNGKPLTIKHN